MKKSHALVFALLITLLIATNFYLIKTQTTNEKEIVKISRVIDGDTLELEDGRKIRLLNINTPEKNNKGFKEATNFLKSYENKSVEVEITETDKYNRFLARIYTPEYLNLEIMKQGLASKFLVEKSELKKFSDAEKYAIQSEKGIWKKSSYFNCFKSKIDRINEIIILTNNCNKVNIASWTLKDESRKQFVFKELEIGNIAIHSKEGKNNETDLFWNSQTSIWNNDRDALYLFDKEGEIVHYNSYGY